ncbi:meiotic coiled-coil protein, putative [Rhizoctonia solani AG-3 Rhs1AP]|uniref:Meiotic coiled-coil protein, putative n=1 Tax=Rhizoctonia solani AG-3 Rhs1AP TaxID=1086054 RepID=X8J4Y8_9AGAM|nr:meiotic coiled-coil protein, putative [Rhizoctonia solani AG-3 Rhs1AP]
MPSPSRLSSSVWPLSLALEPRRRELGTSASIWAPHNVSSFDPFASDSSWNTSHSLLSPSKNESVNSPDPESPEHISMMLRDLGITPSPRPIPMSPGDSLTSPSTPPTLSPTTQILSLGSSSTIHTPTPTRVIEPSLFTPKLSEPLFSSVMDTPTARRISMSSASDEVLIPAPHARRITATNMPPRMAPMGGPVPHSHERVMSWMQRQNLASTQSSPALASFSQMPSRQDWLPLTGPPQAPMAGTHPTSLPGWNAPRPVGTGMWNAQSQPISRPSAGFTGRDDRKVAEPVNFLRLLQPTSQPPYALFVTRIVKNSDQQASIFLQQKLKAANSEETRRPIVDAIVEQGIDMMMNRFGNWAVQRCLEAPCTPRERKRVADAMRGRVIELATNCYGTHVVQKALDCAEPIQLSWPHPAPPIFDYVNKAMQGRWADLARHETGSLIVQHAFENLDEFDKGDCVREVLDSIDILATDQWGSWVVQHLLENGTENDRAQAVDALVQHIPVLAIDPQGIKVIEKAIKSGGPSAVESVAKRLSEPAKSGRRPMIVDLALGTMGSQLISMLLPMLNKALWSVLHDSVKGHIVTLKGSKSGSRIVWLFERAKAQHNTN